MQVLLLQISHLILPPCHYCGFKTFLPFCVGICRQTKPFLLFMLWWAPTFHMDTAWWEVLFIYVFLIIHYCFLEKKIIFFTRLSWRQFPWEANSLFSSYVHHFKSQILDHSLIINRGDSSFCIFPFLTHCFSVSLCTQTICSVFEDRKSSSRSWAKNESCRNFIGKEMSSHGLNRKYKLFSEEKRVDYLHGSR